MKGINKMKVTIVGIEDRSYTDKSTGEVKEMLQFSYIKPFKGENGCGSEVGYETFSAKAFPEQYAIFKKSWEKLIGKTAIISKDVRTFKDKSYAVLDELEIIA